MSLIQGGRAPCWAPCATSTAGATTPRTVPAVAAARALRRRARHSPRYGVPPSGSHGGRGAGLVRPDLRARQLQPQRRFFLCPFADVYGPGRAGDREVMGLIPEPSTAENGEDPSARGRTYAELHHPDHADDRACRAPARSLSSKPRTPSKCSSTHAAPGPSTYVSPATRTTPSTASTNGKNLATTSYLQADRSARPAGRTGRQRWPIVTGRSGDPSAGRVRCGAGHRAERGRRRANPPWCAGSVRSIDD